MALAAPIPETPELPDGIGNALYEWLDVLRTQARGSHWTLTVSSTPDGSETVEVLSDAQAVSLDNTVVVSGRRAIVCRKLKGVSMRVTRPYQAQK